MTVAAEDRHPAEAIFLAFTHALRAAGLAVNADRAIGYLDAASRVGVDDHRAVYWAGRATLCSSPDDIEVYDAVYAAWFSSTDPLVAMATRPGAPRPTGLPRSEVDGTDDDGAEPLAKQASIVEVLRHRDVATLDDEDRARLARLIEEISPLRPTRVAPRRTRSHRGEVDPRRTIRAMLPYLGEPGPIVWRRRGTRARRVVMLIDVSGSMRAYADVLLRVAHRFVRTLPGTEVFTLGTRLTRVTLALRHRDPERALVDAGEAVPDWSGGTRLGESLGAFLDRWGQRGVARSAVVVVLSDGWERGDCRLLGEQAHRLHRLAHRVVWVNPHRGREGYEPLQRGILAVLPHVDDFVAGHSLAAFDELCEVIGRA